MSDSDPLPFQMAVNVEFASSLMPVSLDRQPPSISRNCLEVIVVTAHGETCLIGHFSENDILTELINMKTAE